MLCKNNFYELGMSNLYENENIMKTWKPIVWVIQIVSCKSFNVKHRLCPIFLTSILFSKGLVIKVLDSQTRGPVFKTTGWLNGWLNLSSFRGR